MIDTNERIKELEEALKMARQYVLAWKLKDIQPLLGEDLDADLQKIDDLLAPPK